MSSFKKSLLTYGVADIISRSIGLLTSPFTTRLLTMSQYGAAPLLGAVWAPAALAQYGGMDWAYPFFMARISDDKRKQYLIVTATVIAAASLCIIWFIFSIFAMSGGWLAKYAQVSRPELFFFVFTLLPAGLIYWFCYLLRFLRQANLFVTISLLGRILPVLLVLPLLPIFDQSMRLMVLWGGGFAINAVVLIYASLLLRKLGYNLFDRHFFDAKLGQEMLRYGIVLVPAGGCYALSSVADRLLVGFFLGPDAVALLAIAMALGSVGTLFAGWFGLAFDPHLSSWVASGDKNSYLPKMQNLSTLLGAVFCGLVILTHIWSTWVVDLLYPVTYQPAAILIPLVIFSSFFAVQSRLAVATAMIAQTARFHGILYLVALASNISLNLVLIPRYGVFGAVVATLVSEALILLGWIYLGRYRLRNLRLNWKPVAAFAAITTAFLIFYPGLQTREVANLPIALTMSLITILILAVMLRIVLGHDGIKQVWIHVRK